jgi:hypothetical protein
VIVLLTAAAMVLTEFALRPIIFESLFTVLATVNVQTFVRFEKDIEILPVVSEYVTAVHPRDENAEAVSAVRSAAQSVVEVYHPTGIDSGMSELAPHESVTPDAMRVHTL